MQKVTLQIAPNWSVAVCEDWARVLSHQIKQPYFQDLIKKLDKIDCYEDRVVPPRCKILKALELTNFSDVKVVIVGQDPYPERSYVTGLSFGVHYGAELPGSLRNIIDEVERCVNNDGLLVPSSQPKLIDKENVTLRGWAKQGVLMLNSVLTGEPGIIGAHQGIGWEIFTDALVHAVMHRNKPVVFMLWGSMAQEKLQKLSVAGGGGMLVGVKILASTHPSPLSYNRGVMGMRFQCCGHFTKANSFLKEKGCDIIKWEQTGG